MKILLIESFFTGSHRQWAESFQKYSRHEVEILSLKGRHWKWRMFGGAVSLANDFLKNNFQPDLILATDMLDLSTFLGLTRARTQNIPVGLYFHENQITYPWAGDSGGADAEWNRQYGFINYTSALAADEVFFNSDYHRQSFLEGLASFLKGFPDRKELQNVEAISQKSQVLYLGLDLKALDGGYEKKDNQIPVLLWNHRWEYDKNPDLFFETLFRFKEEAIAFKLIVLGKSYGKVPSVFKQAQSQLEEEIIYFGYAKNRQEYAELLHTADILPVTSQQDFFGGSIVEAIYCECFPLLPDRLAYPEHIPKTFKDRHIYPGDQDFYEALKKIILEKPYLNSGDTFKNFVTQYDWSTLAANYDDALEKAVDKREHKTA
jgi:glycosyltransferase involved in cell wall biosynthesis